MSLKERDALEKTTVVKDPDSPTGYSVTFRYKDPVATRVRLSGQWLFSDKAHASLATSLNATPEEWKKILRKESKFLTDFMLGRIKLDMGSKVGILGLAPYANTFVDALTQVALQFPDEMSEDELTKYRDYMEEFRANLGV